MSQKVNIKEFIQERVRALEELYNKNEEEITVNLLDLSDEKAKDLIQSIYLISLADSQGEFINSLKNDEEFNSILENIIKVIATDEENLEKLSQLEEIEIDEEAEKILNSAIEAVYNLRILSEVADENDDEVKSYLSQYEELFNSTIAELEETETEIEKTEAELSEEASNVAESEVKEEEIPIKNSDIEYILEETDEKETLSKELENIDNAENMNETEGNTSESEDYSKLLESFEGKVELTTAKDNEKIEIEFINPKTSVSDKPQGQVDKSELRKFIIDLVNKGAPISDVKNIANKMFGLIKCVDSPDCFKFPFVELRKASNNKYLVLINRNGVKTVATFVAMPTVKKTYKKDEILIIANKILSIYKLLGEEPPASLNRLVNSNGEDNILLILKDESILYDVANKLEASLEEVLDMYQALNGVFNALYNAGLIDVATEDTENSEQYIEIENDKAFLNLINKFKKFLPGIVNSIAGEEDIEEGFEQELIKEYDSIKSQLEKTLEEKAQLEEELKDLKESLKEFQYEINSLQEDLKKAELLKEKYNILMELASTNSGLGSILDSLSEINSVQELEYFKKFQLKQLIGSENSIKKRKITFKFANSEDEKVIKSLAKEDNSADEKDGNSLSSGNIFDMLSKYI